MPHNLKRFFKIVGISLLIILIAVSTFLTVLFLGGFGKIPSEEQLKEISNESASLVLSKEGSIIGKFYAQNRTNVVYDSLPQFLINALVATEDARFYEHEGVDGRSLLRVLLKTILLQDRSSGGGSTISQQLAKNLFGRNNYGDVSILVNKLKEIILSNRLEKIYSKQEILELYFNTVPFGENVYGIEAASQRFFSCSVTELKIEQAAVLIGLLKANSFYNPRLHPENALKRRIVVLNQMKTYNYLSAEAYDSLKQLPLSISYSNLAVDGYAPYFLVQVKKELHAILEEIKQKAGRQYNPEKDGLRIKTSLDLSLQQSGLRAMQTHLAKIQPLLRKLYRSGKKKRELLQLAEKVAKQEKRNFDSKEKANRLLFHWQADTPVDSVSITDSLKHVLSQLHAGILALNPKNGAIQSWIGGIDFSYYPYDQILAKRQLASTIKPFLYAEAINNGRLPCDYISNDEIVLSDYNNWAPQNYDGQSGGKYSLAAALANSKNLPTVHLYFESEWDKFQELWSKLGFIEELHQQPSAILGTNSVSMQELAVAYSVFANGGKLIQAHSIESIHDKYGNILYKRRQEEAPQVLPNETVKIMNEILMKAVNEGTGRAIRSKYNIRTPLAGKTGTSQNFADAWFVGYNSDLVMVSRVGASYPNIHFTSGRNGSGGRLALPLIGLSLQEALNNKVFYSEQKKAHLSHSNLIDCEDFKDDSKLEKWIDSFKKKPTNLEKEKRKATRKKKRRENFKKLFRKKE